MEPVEDLESTTLAEGVENAILDFMRRSSLMPGDSLPKEEELVSELKVSRHIVREGLSRLKSLGLVESRQRRGMVMKRPNAFVSLGKFARARLLQEQDYRDLMELRVALELGMSDWIFLRRTPDDLDELDSLAGHGGSRQCRYDQAAEVAFHSRLFSICGNRMAGQFREILESSFEPVYANPSRSRSGLRTPTHLEICQALRNGTAEEFHDVMRRHMQPYLKAIRRQP